VKKPAKLVIPGRPIISGGRGVPMHAGKPVPKKPVPKKVAPKIKAARHSAAVKAAKTRAANAKKAKHHTVRKLALGEGVACCSAEALAASLRLLGAVVTDEDVLALYWRTASDEDAGASILATLDAAARFGLAGCRPVFEEVMPPDCLRPILLQLQEPDMSARVSRAGLVFGLDVPGPHAVLATPDGWWSWGELYEPWTDDIGEAWEVTWPGTR
jgi:hypothetical protein